MPAKMFVQFAAQGLEPAIAERQGHEPISPGQVAYRDLGRYYRLLRAEMDRIDYTPEEATAITLACKFWPSIPEHKRPPLAVQMESFLDEWDYATGLARQNNAPTLTRPEAFALRMKVRELTPAGIAATVDGIERFWDRQQRPEADSTPYEADLLAAGLITTQQALLHAATRQ